MAGVSLAYQRVVHQRVAPPGSSSPALDRATDRHAAPASVLMLHDGLGSIGQWHDLPERIAAQSGLPVYVYDRSGHGNSDPVPAQYQTDFMDHEAREVLPEVLAQLGLEAQDTVLVGHSDGGSIALIAASGSAASFSGVVAIAAHTFVEDESVAAIDAIGQHRDKLVQALAKYHKHPDLVFDRWRNVWLSPQFRNWTITGLLAGIDCPVLVLQGDADEYGTAAQISAITDAAPLATGHLISDCGHVAHRDQPDEIVERICGFLAVP